ncbi:MAG: class B sortase [Oscillospiraceae bacterium]|nr:class B sortase [Oscillospiraceae bacterium]
MRRYKKITAIGLAALLGSMACGCGDSQNNPPTESLTEPVVITRAETTTAETTVETTTTTPAPEPLVVREELQEYIDQNPHTAGWITVGGTSIDNVVVQCEDNDLYLDTAFNGNYSQGGTIFADFRGVVNDYDFNQCDNIILYGHNQADGTMFGTLKKYKVTSQNTSRFDFYKEHPTFTFSNLYEEYTYKIIALFVCEVEPRHTRDGVIFDYQNYVIFGSREKTFDEYMENLNERTEIITGVDVREGDKFMTLSTCSNEFEPSRFIVVGRRVRDGESAEVDTSKAELNPNVKEPDWNYIYNGS